MRIGVRAGALAVALFGVACGGSRAVAPAAPPVADEAWPPRAASAGDTATVAEALAGTEGAPVRVRAYLVAVKRPCPYCSVGTNRPAREEIAGHTSRPRGPAAPGCLPCPDPASLLGDDPPGATSPRPSLRAVGAAGGLQPRHVGRAFLFEGVLHKAGADGPELEVTDVRALDGP